MASRRELIIQAVEAALKKPGKPAALNIYRHRTKALNVGNLPAAVPYTINENVTRETVAPPIVERELIISVEVRASGEPADQVLDEHLTWVNDAVLKDPDLAALVISVHERSTTWDAEPSDQMQAAAAVQFAINYRTLYGDPESPV